MMFQSCRIIKLIIINRIGKIEDGNTVFDSAPDEIERQISINAGIAWFEHDKTKVNILDTPGYEDFVGEVISSIAVTEGGVVVISADSGVEVGTSVGVAVGSGVGIMVAVGLGVTATVSSATSAKTGSSEGSS